MISTVFSLANEHETALVAAKAEKAGKEQAARGAEGEGGARAGPFRMRIVSDYVGSNYVGNVNDVGSAGRRDGRGLEVGGTWKDILFLRLRLRLRLRSLFFAASCGLCGSCGFTRRNVFSNGGGAPSPCASIGRGGRESRGRG